MLSSSALYSFHYALVSVDEIITFLIRRRQRFIERYRVSIFLMLFESLTGINKHFNSWSLIPLTLSDV